MIEKSKALRGDEKIFGQKKKRIRVSGPGKEEKNPSSFSSKMKRKG